MTDEKVKKGDLVKVNYVGKFESGEIFDQSKEKPLEFIAGEGMVVKGFDNAILGMGKSEKKTVNLNSDEAYGEKNPSLVQVVPKEAFGPKASELKEGITIGLQHPQQQGQVIPARVDKIEDDKVHLDLNHPLAGKKLSFDIEVVDFKEASEEDKKKFYPKPEEQPQEPKQQETTEQQKPEEPKQQETATEEPKQQETTEQQKPEEPKKEQEEETKKTSDDFTKEVSNSEVEDCDKDCSNCDKH